MKSDYSGHSKQNWFSFEHCKSLVIMKLMTEDFVFDIIFSVNWP